MFETQFQLASRGAAAIVFQPLSTTDFSSIVHDMEQVVRSTAADSGTTVKRSGDPYGFRWLILRGSDFDDLANERELVLKAQVGSVEQELERWFPLWGSLT